MNNHFKNNLKKTNEIVANTLSASNMQEFTCRTIMSQDLFIGGRELLIKHATESYRLRITNQGKLILTK